jgi:transposase-like protein
MEHSHIPLRHWVYALWQVVSCKKGVAALQIKRHTQITYRAALFLLNRLRHGFAHASDVIAKLDEIVEADETYVGGKPRKKGVSKRGRGTKKIPVFAVVQRYGNVRAQVVVSINGETLKGALKKMVSPTAIVLTDDLNSYHGLGKHFEAHHSVNHSAKEYAREWPGEPPKAAKGDSLHSNTIESFFSLIKRGVMGIFHNISPKHLHRYVDEFAWRYNIRTLNDGDRTVSAIQSMIGSRLMYRVPKMAVELG